jgi:hypothetical protein
MDRWQEYRIGPFVGVALAVFTTIGVLAMAAPAHAYTVDGKLGIGYEQTLTGLGAERLGDNKPDIEPAGLTIRYYAGRLGFEAIMHARSLHLADQPSRWGAFLGLGLHIHLFRAPRVNLSVGIRACGGVHRDVDNITLEAQEMRFGMSLEVPLRAMFFLSDHFAFSAAVGPVVAFNGKRGNPLTGQHDSIDLSLFRGAFSGGLGFVVFLR